MRSRSSERPGRRRFPPAWAIALTGVVAGGAALRLHFGLDEYGIYWPDEIYQSVEQAHRLVYGYGLVPWEFVDGARNWTFPGLLGGVLWTGKALQLTDPDAYLTLSRLTFIALSTATVVGVYVLARSQNASRPAAIAGAAAFAFAPPIVYFSHRALSEVASTLPVVLGFALALGPRARNGDRLPLLAGASLLGFATLLRIQNGLLCGALLVVFACRRQWRQGAEVALVFAGWGFLLGLLDALTWGEWFQSASTYLRFSLIEEGAEQWGTSPWNYYLQVMLESIPVLAILVGALALAAWRRSPALLLVSAVFLAAHSWTAHKELRFILPVVPLLCALAAVGLDVVRDRLPRVGHLAPHALALVAVASALQTGQLSFEDVGAEGDVGAGDSQDSAWGQFAEGNRLLLAANEREDLCGIKIEHEDWWVTGGLSHLHRDVPFYARDGPPRSSRHFNYVITYRGERSGETIAQDGSHALVRLGGPCRPDRD